MYIVLPRVGADIAINTKITAIINIIKLINRSNVLLLIGSTPLSRFLVEYQSQYYTKSNTHTVRNGKIKCSIRRGTKAFMFNSAKHICVV